MGWTRLLLEGLVLTRYSRSGQTTVEVSGRGLSSVVEQNKLIISSIIFSYQNNTLIIIIMIPGYANPLLGTVLSYGDWGVHLLVLCVKLLSKICHEFCGQANITRKPALTGDKFIMCVKFPIGIGPAWELLPKDKACGLEWDMYMVRWWWHTSPRIGYKHLGGFTDRACYSSFCDIITWLERSYIISKDTQYPAGSRLIVQRQRTLDPAVTAKKYCSDIGTR